MRMEDIFTLPVKDIANDNCALFLWVTMPLMFETYPIFEHWGFKYKTVAFTWVKQNKKADTLFMGGGSYTRSNTELCLLGVKGRVKRVDNGVRSVIVSHRGRHSEKPKEARERIVQLLGDRPRIELFARDCVEGWDAWGLEV